MTVTINGTTGITTPALDSDGTLIADGLTIAGATSLTGNLTVDGGTVKLDGNYPVGSENVALGEFTLSNLSTGGGNTAVGRGSLYSLTSAGSNSGFGTNSLVNNTTGATNTAIGASALHFNTTASSNTAVGYQAGYGNITGPRNSFFGYQAGLVNTAGYNCFIGTSAGLASTAYGNTFVGSDYSGGSGSLITSGTRNTIIGGYDGNKGGLDIRSSNNNIVLSDGDGNPRYYIDSLNRHYIGKNTLAVTSVGRVTYPDGSTNIATNGGGLFYFYYASTGAAVGSIQHGASTTSYNTSSDYRLKENVVYDWDATTRLKQLKPARFNFITEADRTVDGFLAHEAQAVVPECVTGTKDAVNADGVAVMQGIDQSKLVPLLVKTIQELEARIAALEAV